MLLAGRVSQRYKRLILGRRRLRRCYARLANTFAPAYHLYVNIWVRLQILCRPDRVCEHGKSSQSSLQEYCLLRNPREAICGTGRRGGLGVEDHVVRLPLLSILSLPFRRGFLMLLRNFYGMDRLVGGVINFGLPGILLSRVKFVYE